MIYELEGEKIQRAQKYFQRQRPNSTRYQEPWPELRHKNRDRKKNRKQNRHHLLNKCRRGTSTSENLLWLDIQKHNYLHRVFKNDDPEYIILVLERMMRMKNYRRFRGVHVIQDRERSQVA